jgi:hypothetical protein
MNGTLVLSNKLRCFQLLSIIYLVATLCACSHGDTSPSAAEVEAGVRSHVPDVSEGVFSVVSITKTDGLARQDGTYVADFKAEVKFDTCGYFVWKSNRVTKYNGACPASPGQTASYLGNTIYGVGSQVTIPGKAAFVKKESGWQLSEISMTMPN